MPQNQHNDAAKHHDENAKQQPTPAEQRDKSKHDDARRTAQNMHDQSGKSQDDSKRTHDKSQGQKDEMTQKSGHGS